MWLTVGLLLLILIVGGAAELLLERSAERYHDDDRADLRPGISSWLSAILAVPIALALLLVSFFMTDKAFSTAQPVQLLVTVATAGAFVALAFYLLWATYVTAFHRLKCDGKTISRKTLFGRQSLPMSLIEHVRGNRFFYTIDFVNGTRWYLAPLRGIRRLFNPSRPT